MEEYQKRLLNQVYNAICREPGSPIPIIQLLVEHHQNVQILREDLEKALHVLEKMGCISAGPYPSLLRPSQKMMTGYKAIKTPQI